MDNKEARKIILSIVLKVDVSEISYLGSGNFACAYLYKGKVYKVTRDVEDFILSSKASKNPRKYPHFVRIYSTKIIKFDDSLSNLTRGYSELYLIVSEYSEPIGDDFRTSEVAIIWDKIQRTVGSRRYLRSSTSIRPLSEIRPTTTNLQLFEAVYNEYVKVLKWYKTQGITEWDNHTDNISWANGRVKVLDLGFNGTNYRVRYSRRAKVEINISVTELNRKYGTQIIESIPYVYNDNDDLPF